MGRNLEKGTRRQGRGRHVLPRFGEHCCSLTTPCHPGSSQPGAGVLRQEQAEALRLGWRGRTCGGQGRGFHSDPHAAAGLSPLRGRLRRWRHPGNPASHADVAGERPPSTPGITSGTRAQS